MEYLKNAKVRIDEATELIGRAIGLEKLSTIERDIILDKLAKAYEGILTEKVLDSGSANTPRVEAERLPKQKIVLAEPVTMKDNAAEVQIVKPDDITILSIQEDNPKEAKKSEISSISKAAAKIEPKVPEKTKVEEHSEGEILSEKFQGKHKFRNEIIAEHSTKLDMSTKLQNKPIGDLAKAIGINDKFLFIKELFGGDSARYSETISHLNAFSDLNDAIIYLQDNFDWSDGNEYAAIFIDLVRRKFI